MEKARCRNRAGGVSVIDSAQPNAALAEANAMSSAGRVWTIWETSRMIAVWVRGSVSHVWRSSFIDQFGSTINMRCMRERCGAAWSVELQCARVDGVYELLSHGTGVGTLTSTFCVAWSGYSDAQLKNCFPCNLCQHCARELFVSVRFLFLPGIRAYVVHRRESGSPVWYRIYSEKKTCKVVEVMNECTAPSAEAEDRPFQNLLVSFSRSS